MRPGPQAVRALGLLLALSRLAPFVPHASWALVAGLAAVAAAVLVERRALARVRLSHEEAASFVLSLDEEETVAFRLATDAARPVHLTVRRTWPRLVAVPSTTLRGVCRPGESLALQCPVRGVQRGNAKLDGPHVAFTFRGW